MPDGVRTATSVARVPVAFHRSEVRAIDPLTLYAILRLRVDVFVVEQACPYPDLDGRDVEPGDRLTSALPPSGRAVRAATT